MAEKQKSVVVLYNRVGEDEYEHLRAIDPKELDFTPSYDVHVATDQEEYEAIMKALGSEGFRTKGLNLEEKLSNLMRLATRKPPDVVFNLVEYFHDDSRLEGAIAAFLELCRLPYTGATPFCLSLCRHKGLLKQVLLQNDIATPRYRLLDEPKIPPRHRLSYPLIVKPSRQDASSGVESQSVVYDYTQLRQQLERIYLEFGAPILVEEFIAGKELHVSVMGNNPAKALPIVEFDFSELYEGHPPLITYDVKWNPLSLAYHRVHSLCPAQLDKKTDRLVREQAVRAYKAASCRDYARIDMRMGFDGVPYILEINPNPDLTEGVSFMESAEVEGLTFSQTLRRIVEFAMERSGISTQ